jgi:hypothetical protein
MSWLAAGWEHRRAAFEWAQIIPLAVMALIGVIFDWQATPTRNAIVVPVGELELEPAGD